MRRWALVAVLVCGLSGVSAAAAKGGGPRVSWSPENPGDGQPFLLFVDGLPRTAKVTGRYLKQNLRFSYDESAGRFVALAAVPLGTRPRSRRVRVYAKDRGLRVRLWAKVKSKWVRYPQSTVRIRPQKGAVKRGEKAVSGKEKIREALGRRTAKRYWSLPFHRPLTTKITAVFGVRRRYLKIKGKRVVRRWRGRHMGLDIDGNGGEPIGVVADGVVATSGHFYGTGKCVFVDHGQGFITGYYHMSRILVKPGDRVKKAQVIGKVGATGRVSGPHLHLAVHVNGSRVDPQALLGLGRSQN